MATSFPPGGDREAARRWLRERTPIAPTGSPPTHGELLRDQRDRLLAEAGFPPVTHDVSLKMTWQPDTDRARTGSLSAGTAATLKGLSEGVRFSEPDRRVLEGELIEASLRRGSVVIELDSGTIVNARTEAAVTSRLRDDLLGKRVVAESEVTIAHYAGGRQKEIYVVTDISPAGR